MEMKEALKRIFVLEAENEKLKKEQEEFQTELLKRIQVIKQMKPIKRFFAYGKLLWSLIETIERSINK